MSGAYNEPLKSVNFERMKQLIFKFWLSNVVISIVLFIIYRFAISETETKEGTFFEEWMYFFDLLLSIGYSLIYFIGMLIFSLILFLNLFEKIRNHFYLSMLTFLGIPIVAVVYVICITIIINDSTGNYSPNFATTFLIFLFIYLISNSIQFVIFRKKISHTFKRGES